MSSAEIKNEIHKLVVETEDLKVLRAIKEIFEAMRKSDDSDKDWWEELSPNQQKLVTASLKQADAGNYISQNDARSRIADWINSKN